MTEEEEEKDEGGYKESEFETSGCMRGQLSGRQSVGD